MSTGRCLTKFSELYNQYPTDKPLGIFVLGHLLNFLNFVVLSTITTDKFTDTYTSISAYVIDQLALLQTFYNLICTINSNQVSGQSTHHATSISITCGISAACISAYHTNSDSPHASMYAFIAIALAETINQAIRNIANDICHPTQNATPTPGKPSAIPPTKEDKPVNLLTEKPRRPRSHTR